MESKAWSQEEQHELLKIHDRVGTNNWAFIANQLNRNNGGKLRNGKQCRHRFIHYLQDGVKRDGKVQWGAEECKQIIDLFEENGSKWSSISKAMPGWSENCVKNKFNGLLNRLIRKLNKCSHSEPKEMRGLIKIQSVKNIVQKIDEHEQDLVFHHLHSKSLRGAILMLALKVSQNMEMQAEIEELKREIHSFHSKNKSLIMTKGRKKGKHPKPARKINNQFKENNQQGFPGGKKREEEREEREEKREQEREQQEREEEREEKREQKISRNIEEKGYEQMRDEDVDNMLWEYDEIKKKYKTAAQNLDREVCEIMNQDYRPTHIYEDLQ